MLFVGRFGAIVRRTKKTIAERERREDMCLPGYNTGFNRFNCRVLFKGQTPSQNKADFGFAPAYRCDWLQNSRVLRRQRPSIEVERASGLKEDLSKGTAQHLIGSSDSSRSSYNSEQSRDRSTPIRDERQSPDAIPPQRRSSLNLRRPHPPLFHRYAFNRRSTRPPIATSKHRLTPRGLNLLQPPGFKGNITQLTLSGFNRNAAFLPLAQLRKHRAFRSSVSTICALLKRTNFPHLGPSKGLERVPVWQRKHKDTSANT
ncbi:hypothetical protein DdX_03696 [Ditylenchus destructor]|uniref:Uncharacterized protein n=1 Tax=Ditylenchus destructor TaxID=166010 RepID=A0AAD4RBI3_9BILA|nr:hypothetical protein DdX_03696 [Ditylenchus destructor]